MANKVSRSLRLFLLFIRRRFPYISFPFLTLRFLRIHLGRISFWALGYLLSRLNRRWRFWLDSRDINIYLNCLPCVCLLEAAQRPIGHESMLQHLFGIVFSWRPAVRANRTRRRRIWCRCNGLC